MVSLKTVIAGATIGVMIAGPAWAQARSGAAPGGGSGGQALTSQVQSPTSPGRAGTSPGQSGRTPGQTVGGNPGSGGIAPGQNPAFRPPGQTFNTPGIKKTAIKKRTTKNPL